MDQQTTAAETNADAGTQTEFPALRTTVTAPLRFIVPQDAKPAFHAAALTGGEPEVFFETEDIPVTIHDMREVAEDLSVDREGFELWFIPTGVYDLHDDETVTTDYYAEVDALLTERFDASRVVIFDATRRADTKDGAENPDGPRGPAARVHVDYTVTSGPQRVRDVLGEEEAERLFASGARIIQVNVWRPLHGPVVRSPLALADAASVATKELVATDQVFPDRVGEIYQVAHGDGQRWYYAPEMTADEVILIKGWDTLDDGRAIFTPHGAFNHPDTPAGAPPRESIEIRTLVIIE